MTKRARVPGTFTRAEETRAPEPPPHRYADQPARGKNAYHCDTCGGYVVTIDRDPGVTPMFLACRVPPREDGPPCGGRMASMMYPAEPWPIDATPTWEWYRPSKSERAAMSYEMRDHVDRGGLALRKIEAIAA